MKRNPVPDKNMNLPFPIHVVNSPDSPEFAHLSRALQLTAVLALDAEWKPRSRSDPPDSPSRLPTVTLLQLACQLGAGPTAETLVFLLDLSALPLTSLWESLTEVFASPDVLKLGFRFKQDLVYLSHTFSSAGCLPGFDKVEPYMDITNVYHYLQPKDSGRKFPRETKSLAAVCKELLGITLSKELQCSDWSRRPLTEEQINYAAMDAHCLLRIFSIFQAKVSHKGESGNGLELHSAAASLGLKEILERHDVGKLIIWNVPEAVNIILATVSAYDSSKASAIVGLNLGNVCRRTMPMLEPLFKIVRKYGERILLRESDRRPKASKKIGKKKSTLVATSRQKYRNSDNDAADWQGPPPWDLSLGGDGCPKFLCDVMVEGLAKHLRCVGIDAAIPNSKKPDARELIDQVCKEQRVLLTRDAKLLRHQYLVNNQIYRVKSLLKNEQLLEVITTFQLKINEDQLMSRCTKCNGRFIQKPLTTEEAVEAAKGFQRIPSCLFDKNVEFWQCMECNQLYWEGTQYHNAVQKFIDVCKLN